MTKSEEATMANPYMASLFTHQNPYNTQATRDVADRERKGGLVGSFESADAVYNPKSEIRNLISKKIKAREKQERNAPKQEGATGGLL